MRIYWHLLLLVNSYAALAQPSDYTLSQDPVFTTVLTRRLTYPNGAQRSGVYARVYAGFTVDEKGRIKNISVLNHLDRNSKFGFETTVLVALKKLPALSIHYTGQYILPVAFTYVDYRHPNQPFISRDTFNAMSLVDRVLLNEVKVLGSTINSYERRRSILRNEPY